MNKGTRNQLEIKLKKMLDHLNQAHDRQKQPARHSGTGNIIRRRKGKKEKGESGPSKAEITVMVNEQQAMKFIESSKVVTIHELAKQAGVKISAANAFLQNSVKSGKVKRVGGYSGHYIYKSASS